MKRCHLAVVRALTIAALLFHGTLLLRPPELFLARPLIEDAFYTMTVSAWIAQGKGITIDGHLPTNGIQPLVCFIYIPAFVLTNGDRMSALVPVLATQSVIFSATVFCIAAFASGLQREVMRRKDVFWIVALLSAWSSMLLQHMLNGLETGMAAGFAFGTTACYNRFVERDERRTTRWAALGILMGLAVLSRIDLAILVVALVGWHCSRGRSWNRRRVVESSLIGAAALVVSLPWWAYNVIQFGSLMPISGQAQAMLNDDRASIIRTTLVFLADAFVYTTHTPITWQYTFPLFGLTLLSIAVGLVLAVGRSLNAIADALRTWSRSWDFDKAVPLACFSLFLVVYYSVFFGAPHFSSRYLLPVRVLTSLLVVTLLISTFERATRMSRAGFIGLVGVAMSVTAYYFSWNFTGHNGSEYRNRADWIQRHVSPFERVGMFQSGTAGYLCRNVTNLDGKVNVNALLATQQGRLAEYLIESRFEYLMEWNMFLSPVFKNARLRSMYTKVDQLSDETMVFRIKDSFRRRN